MNVTKLYSQPFYSNEKNRSAHPVTAVSPLSCLLNLTHTKHENIKLLIKYQLINDGIFASFYTIRVKLIQTVNNFYHSFNNNKTISFLQLSFSKKRFDFFVLFKTF